MLEIITQLIYSFYRIYLSVYTIIFLFVSRKE